MEDKDYSYSGLVSRIDTDLVKGTNEIKSILKEIEENEIRCQEAEREYKRTISKRNTLNAAITDISAHLKLKNPFTVTIDKKAFTINCTYENSMVKVVISESNLL